MSWWKRRKTPATPATPVAEQGTSALSWLSANRVLAVVYLFIVLAIGFKIPPAEQDLHYSASRKLGENTRLVSEHLVPPGHVPLEAAHSLSKERGALVGMYLRRTVNAGETLKTEDVRPWPRIEGDKAIPVELDTEPDWLLLNQDTTVEVWVGDKKDPIRARVLAVVPSGKKWQVLLDRSAVPDGFGYPKDQPKLRVLSLP